MQRSLPESPSVPAPRCSVLMPVYNAERYVAQAVESILGQTFRDFELVIVDDGSTDRSREMLHYFAAGDPRIRLVSRANTGYLRALNEGLALCQGEYVARMDADDIALPERLQRQIAFLDRHPECLMVGSALLRIDADGDVLCEEPLPVVHDEIESRLWSGQGAIGHPAALVRRQSLVDVGGYREEYYGAEDHDLWLRLAERGRLANLAEPLLMCRIHTGNFTFVNAERGQAAARAAVVDASRRRGWPQPSFGALAAPQSAAERQRAWARSALYAGHYRTARKHALAAWRQRPGQIDSWVLLAHAVLGRWARPLRSMYRRLR
ncbi:MAG TPA: glycosyltransferase [Pirellulales bacterium]|nr:glycosyltransferase [Pirellulales bacterium]